MPPHVTAGGPLTSAKLCVPATLAIALRQQVNPSIQFHAADQDVPVSVVAAAAAPLSARQPLHVSAAALTTRNCVSKSSRSSSNLPQHVILSIRHRVSTSWRIASPRMPQPCKSPSEHEYKASPAASCPAARSADAAENKLRSCSPSSGLCPCLTLQLPQPSLLVFHQG